MYFFGMLIVMHAVVDNTLKTNVMTSFYIVLEVIAFIAVIVVPLAGPKTKKITPIKTTGSLAVNGEGFLEPVRQVAEAHLPVH